MKKMTQIGILLFSFCFIVLLSYNQGMCRSGKDFKKIGTYGSKNIKGFNYYVENPTKEKIKTFCATMVERYQEGKKRILKIHFFDNKKRTSKKYLICDFWDNPFIKKSKLTFHKTIE